MSCYGSCPFECAYKNLARTMCQDLNNAGITTFFTGDIPDDRRSSVRVELIAALEQATIFIPLISEAFEQNHDCKRELGMSFEWNKMIIPIVVQPGFSPVTVRPFLTGIKIYDMSSPDQYKAKLLEIIQTIRPLVPGKKDRTTGSAAGDQDI